MTAHIAGPLHWEGLGRTGPPMALLHPNPMDHTAWLYQMAHLSTWFRCIGVDLPGYGRSPRASSGVTMAEIAEACWEAIEETADGPAVLVGESVGASVALHMAYARPDQVVAIIVSGTGYRAERTVGRRRIPAYQAQGIAYRYEHTFRDFGPAFRDTDLARYFAAIFAERNAWADADSIIELYRALDAPPPPDLYDAIRVPMLIITGSEDNAHQAAFALQERVTGCELATIAGAGHACNMERPWEWDRLAIDFLRAHRIVSSPITP